jgi:NADPH2:quinone reductase
VQLAKLLGAGRVVGAGRNAEQLERVRELGADEVVELGGGDLFAAFEEAAGGPLDIVIDPLWGEPAMAALRVLATEGRLVNVGQSAGTDVRIPLELVRNRQGAVHAISSGWTGLERKASLYDRLLDYALSGHLTVDREVVPLDDVATAWERQDASPGRKLVISLAG